MTKLRIILFILLSVSCSNLSLAQKKTKQVPLSIPSPLSDSAFFKSLTYRNVGPTRGGRVTAVEGITTRPSTFYMGSSGGGVWKTEDYGTTWNNISDGYFASPSIGGIRAFQLNPNIIYVGTGSDGIRSNVIVGKGVYKTLDAGKTWKSIGLEQAGLIGAIEIHPQHSDTVFVAAVGQPFQPNKERGVFRTHNGGKSWEQVLFLADTIGAVDLEFAPNNPDIIYATMWRTERKPWTIISGGKQAGGIFKSTDGGTQWKKLSQGLPQGLIGKIDLAVSADDPNRLYALVEAPKGAGGLYRSDDQGESFKLISDKKELLDRPFYYCNLEANPLNADVLFVMSTEFFKSIDAGKSWKKVMPPHGDNHDLWINKRDTSIMIQSNDGGANVTINGGKTWSSQNNQPTAELYQIEADDQYPYWIYAGQQDNTTISIPSLPPYDAPGGPTSFWMSVGGCETGPAVPKPGNADIVYSSCKGRFGVYDKRTGQERMYVVGAANIYGHDPDELKYRFQRVSPVHVSSHNSNVVYHASQYLHKTMNDGMSWETISPDLTANDPDKQILSGTPITQDITGEEFYSTIYDVKESVLKEGLIWVGANDGPVSVTLDGGKRWARVTPPELLPGGRIDCVEPSPHKESKAYFCALRYQLGDWNPYVYKTLDYGKHWTLLTNGNNGIPNNYPVRIMREDPEVEGLLYAGTEFGLYISLDDGKTWKSFQQNLPITPVTDIKIFRKDLMISTMGRSFWILDNISPLHQLSQAKKSIVFLYKPVDTHRYHYSGTPKTNVPYYPAPSVIIDYYLKSTPAGDIRIDILSDNRVVRTFSSFTRNDTSKAEGKNMATGFVKNDLKADLEKSDGAHRIRWDMLHEGPWDKDPSKSKKGGPLAKPGIYEVRMEVDGQNFVQSFKILPDPRLLGKVTNNDMAAQETLALQVRDLEDSAKRIANKVLAQRKGLSLMMKAKKTSDSQIELDKQLSKLEEELVTKEGPYQKPMLIDQLNYLKSLLDQADQRPGKDVYDRYDELKTLAEKIFLAYLAKNQKM